MSVCVLGSLNLDETYFVAELPREGMTVIAERVTQSAGGKGLNQAVAAARGAATAMIGIVGSDAAGDRLIGLLQESGVDTAGIARNAGEPTGRALVALSSTGGNQIIVVPGANGTLDPSGVERCIPAQTRVVLAQLESPMSAIAALFTSKKTQSACKILNAAPADIDAAKLFGLADVLIFNQSEFAAYLQLDTEPTVVQELLCARRLLTRPGQAVVVTLGAQGAVLVSPDHTFSVEAHHVDVKDTTGAGDCFCGTFAAAIANGADLARALGLANAAAALSTLKFGAAPSIPAWDRVEALAAVPLKTRNRQSP